MVAITAQRPADSLDMFSGNSSNFSSGAARGPPFVEKRSPFSGVNILHPPGGASSITFGGYGDSVPPHRAGESPMYGRRAGPPSSGLPPQSAQSASFQSGGGYAQPKAQDYMGGKNITQSPGGESSVCLSWGADEQHHFPSREEHFHVRNPQRHGYSANNQVQHEHHAPQPRQRRGDSYGYVQDAFGGKNIMQSPGGISSVNLSWGHGDNSHSHHARSTLNAPASHSYPQPQGTVDNQKSFIQGHPEQGYVNHGRRSDRTDAYGYIQDPFGGKNITQAPGGNSNISLGWKGNGRETLAPVSNASQPGRSSPHMNVDPASQSNMGYSRRAIPQPYVPVRQPDSIPSFSGLNIVNPPGGRQSFSIYG